MNKNTDHGKIINVEMKLDCKQFVILHIQVRHALPISLLILRKKNRQFCSLRWNDITERDDDMNPWKQTHTLVSLPMIFQNSAQSTLFQ